MVIFNTSSPFFKLLNSEPMKLFRFNNSLLYVGVILLTACGSGGSETAKDSTATADTTTKAPPPSTIVTTPQNMVVIYHKVADYAKWLASYEGHDSARMAAGLHNYVIGRGLQDSNMVMVALRSDDTAKAMAFAKDPGLKAAMKKGGIVGTPMITFVTETWQDTGKTDILLRGRTALTVKDWDVFLKGYQDGKQERMDNGLIDRVIGHDLDDNKKVTIVAAIADSAKAFAYYKSDALKKRREAGGVVGDPVRFFYRIAKHY
jgi:hypothetical protein